jgi:hypothetical protein
MNNEQVIKESEELIESFKPFCIERLQYDIESFIKIKAIQLAIITQERVVRKIKEVGDNYNKMSLDWFPHTELEKEKAILNHLKTLI